MSYDHRVRPIAIALVLVVTAASAVAQPVSYRLRGEVPLGQKPQIEVSAAESVSDLAIELDRSDGKHFSLKQRSLAKGKAVVLGIGDGAAGKASYKGTISAKPASGAAWKSDLSFDTLVATPIKVSYDAAHLDLDKRVLQFKVSRAIDKADIVAIGEDGTELGKGTATFRDAGADWLSVSWTQPANTRVMMLKLRVAASDGVATNVELVPWSVEIAHEDVSFSTDSAVIEPGEDKKLDASLVKINDVVARGEKFMKMKLYVAGHTDTVGSPAKNRTLSSNRAAAIAAYFRKKGLAIPIAVAGFGEDVLKVKTADSTDERANRRVDYVIGPANGAPPFGGAYLKAKVTWKQLR